MKFLDEVLIQAIAGKGGHGCLSFRREKYIPRGGPDGGNGGEGGNVYLRADSNLNTLIDFHGQYAYLAKNGQSGSGQNRAGKKGEDLTLFVPVGTEVFNAGTEECIGDLTQVDSKLLVAQGGQHGVGNACFKSSTRRSPREYTLGKPGESRLLRLSLKLLADVGLVGLPNAGKSTLIRAISAATPKVADYPFTTLIPQLGVVSLAEGHSFVVADIPGLIEGAAQGSGLGIQFLKHLERTRLLLHVVDMCPLDGHDPLEDIKIIEQELGQYTAKLLDKPRWLVLNKLDLIEESSRQRHCDRFIHRMKVNQRTSLFIISGIQQEGTKALCAKVMAFLISDL